MSKDLIQIGILKKKAEDELLKVNPEDYIINNFLDRCRKLYKKLNENETFKNE